VKFYTKCAVLNGFVQLKNQIYAIKILCQQQLHRRVICG